MNAGTTTRCGSWILIVLAMCGAAPRAEAMDPHALYEQRCVRCHAAHAGTFVPEALERRGDQIVGRKTGRDLRSFLADGHGKLKPPEIDVMVDHLESILRSGALFRRKCLICHERAVVVARRWLIVREGKLIGRYSGRAMDTFLQNHGRLEGAEIELMLGVLTRQLATN